MTDLRVGQNNLVVCEHAYEHVS